MPWFRMWVYTLRSTVKKSVQLAGRLILSQCATVPLIV
jgi:hypothetical protein